jgi:glycosyltransferase involved in cell wall biosynthesis
LGLLESIPCGHFDDFSILIVDNLSADNTADLCRQWAVANKAVEVKILRPKKNLGYSGSQKLAYNYILNEMPWVDKVFMLHGDGQYPAALLGELYSAFSDDDVAVVYGYRSKTKYPLMEETPKSTYFVIKMLGFLESIITGVSRKEWHSGFVAYKTSFLALINFEMVTETPHIDGHLSYLAGILNVKVVPVGIYKKYKNLTAFDGAERIRYVINVLKLMFHFRFKNSKLFLFVEGMHRAVPEYNIYYDGA